MRRIVTAISAAALAFSMVSLAMPANAAGGFDSAYAGESAFLTLNPGQGGTFTVFFANTGTNSWTKGTATQVDLAACLEDKVTCNQQDASEAPFNPGGATGWLSSTRYATTTQTAVAPGAIGTFTYNVMVPNTATGLHRFNGALVVSTTGADVHNEGYYQDVNIPGQQATCTPSTITTTPKVAQEIVGATHTQLATVLCADGKGSGNAAVTFAIAAPVGSLNSNLTLTGVTDATGKVSVTWTRANPDTDTVEVFPTAQPNIRDVATIFWVVQPVLSCTPTTTGTVLNGQNRIFTLTLRDQQTGAVVTTPTVIAVTVAADVTKGTATINGTDVTGTSKAGNTQLTVTTDANGNATLTVSGTNSTVTGVVFRDTNPANGKVDNGEFQATCGTTTFQAVQAVTLAVTPTTAATIAQSGQRIYTVTATDSAGNPTSATVNIGFVENLLSTTGTSARITWFDIDSAAADQRGSQSSTSSFARQSVCNRVSGGTWNANSGTVLGTDIKDATTAYKRDRDTGTITSGNYGSVTGFTSTYPKVLGNVLIPSIGRATFAICDEVAGDTATPVAFQDTEAAADFIPQAGEPQAQGGTVTYAAPVLTSGVVFSQISGGSDILPATNSAGETTGNATQKFGLGFEQFTFRMRDQSRKGDFPSLATGTVAGSCTGNTAGTCPVAANNVGQTVIWTVQNTGSSNVFIIDFDGSASATPITVPPGQSIQVQSPILASGNDCVPGGRDMGGTTIYSGGGSGEYGQVDCFDSANIQLNAGAATGATVTGTLVSNGAISGSSTISWVSAVAEPTEPAGVSFTASGTVLAVNTFGFNDQDSQPACNEGGLGGATNAPGGSGACYYLLTTASGTIYKINFGGTAFSQTSGSGTAHSSDTYIYLGTQFAGVQICTDSGNSYLPCSVIYNANGTTGSSVTYTTASCTATPTQCVEEPLAQFIGVLSTGNKVTYTNNSVQPAQVIVASPTTGTAIHNITATQ